jgi:hypothetical protein
MALLLYYVTQVGELLESHREVFCEVLELETWKLEVEHCCLLDVVRRVGF